MDKIYFFLALACVLPGTFAATDRQVVTVDTNVGTMNGYVKETTYLGETYKIDRFLGIPYAEAPVGERRFMKALPKAPFTAPFDAFAHGSMCMQMPGLEWFFQDMDFNYSEDCLFLNIYAPHSRTEGNVNIPVMIFIHGGGFNGGFPDNYPGDNIAAHGNVIVITIGYRLSLWGYLTTGNDIAPGNAGLWDQHMAIKWVHDNIAAFGGDNQRITIFGESAGSASVIYQALYPGNKGLFQRAIAQSGSIESYWASQKEGPKYAKILASFNKCNIDDTQAMVTCLQKLSNDRLVEMVSNTSYGLLNFPFPFTPNRDGDFVKYDPRAAFNELPNDVSDMYKSVDLLTGVNTAEGTVALSPFMGVTDAESFQPSRTEFIDVLTPLLVNALYPERNGDMNLLRNLIVNEYTNWNSSDDDPLELRHTFVDMHGDAGFLGPLYSTINKHAEISSNNTFMYVLDIIPTTKLFTQISWLNRLAHGEELYAVFGYKSYNDGKNGFGEAQWERLLSKDIITLWSNFAYSGNPNKPVDLGLNWSPYTETNQQFLQISRDMTSSNVKQHWNMRRGYFWSHVLPDIVSKVTCTESPESSDYQANGYCEKDGGCSP